MKQQIQTELSTIVYNWLSDAGNKVCKDYCKQEITTHAEYPAITAVVDFLDAGNMGYQVVQADASYIHKFNYPLLAHIKKPGNEYMHIISNTAAWDEQKEMTQHWSGITIFPEKNATWNNEENNAATKNTRKQKYLFYVWCSIGIILYAESIYFKPEIWYNLFGFLSLVGVFVSIAAFATELGIKSDAVKKVCGTVAKGGCETVLKSKLANGVFGITPSDAAVLYFSSQFIIYLTTSFFTNIFSALPYIALLGIGIAGLSIYTQAVVIKQWCALCLSIATVLLLQFFSSLFLLKSFSIYSIVAFSAVGLLLLTILLPIKTLQKNIIAAKPQLIELKKWQADASIFLELLKKEPTVDTTIWENDLIIGNPNAPIIITVACNPYCGPCAEAHKELDEILERFEGKVKVQVRLLFMLENETDKLTIASKALLQKGISTKNNIELQKMLTDWFDWMDYEKWITKWKQEKDIDAKNEMTKHAKWIKENEIRYTPTFFINGKKLPARYNLKKVEKIIPQLANEIAM